MFNRFPIPCCKHYVCDCCLTDAEVIDKDIAKQLKQGRRRNLNERKLLLLGKINNDQIVLLIDWKISAFFHRKCWGWKVIGDFVWNGIWFVLIRSTFLKQMKLIHGQGFRPDEKRRLVPFIYRQILSVVRCICRAMRMLCIDFEKDQSEVLFQLEIPSINPIFFRNMLVYWVHPIMMMNTIMYLHCLLE